MKLWPERCISKGKLLVRSLTRPLPIINLINCVFVVPHSANLPLCICLLFLAITFSTSSFPVIRLHFKQYILWLYKRKILDNKNGSKEHILAFYGNTVKSHTIANNVRGQNVGKSGSGKTTLLPEYQVLRKAMDAKLPKKLFSQYSVINA